MDRQKLICPFCRTRLGIEEVRPAARPRMVPVTCFKCGRRFWWKAGDDGKISYIKR